MKKIYEKKSSLPTVSMPSDEKSLRTWINNFYITAATSDHTRKAYRSDVRHFENWGGRLPATPEIIVRYLEAYATELNPRTLARRLTALKQWHAYQNLADPTQHPLVAKTLFGIIRIHGRPKNKARALNPAELETIVRYLKTEQTFAATRDNALLQIGYFGALRRSELVAIQYEHIRWEKEGIEILIPVSKTDQQHQGQYCAIPYGRQPLCPITALQHWLTQANIQQGAIFRRLLAGDRVGNRRLTPLSVNLILKNRAQSAGLARAEDFSSHSLRRGLATSAARAGAPLHALMRAGRWKHPATAMEYIEANERFSDNAADSVLKKIAFAEDA